MNKRTVLKVFVLVMLSIFILTSCKPANGNSKDESITDNSNTSENGRDSIKDTVPDNLKFDGEVVTILVREGEITELEFFAEELTSSVLNDAIYNRNKKIEQRLGIEIKTLVKEPESAYDALNFNNKVRTDITQLGKTEYDIVASYGYFGVILGNEGMYYNLQEVPHLDLEKTWWNQDFVNEMTINNKLYFAIGDASFTSIDYATATFFNQNLLQQWCGDVNLYDVVDSGKWTLDYFSTLLKDVYSDFNGDGNRDENDFYGIGMATASIPLDALFMGSNLSVTEKNAEGIPGLAFYNEDTTKFFDTMYSLFYENTGVFPGEYTTESVDMMTEKFQEEETVFLISGLNSIEKLREIDFTYGILPIPKRDESQDKYYTASHDSYSILSIPVCITEDRLPLTGATLELLAAESYKMVTPAYFEAVMKKRYFETEDDARMYDIILSGIRYNFGVVNSISLDDIQHLVRKVVADKSMDFTSAYKAQEDIVKIKLEELLEYLNEQN